MKIKSLLRSARRAAALFALVALIHLPATPSARAAGAAESLENGIYTEETKGDLKAACEIYQQIVNDPNADRSLVAQAQLRLGLCELKLGNKPKAISALDQLTLEFPDKDHLLQTLDQHMPGMLDEMIKQIEQNYVLEVDRSELMDAAIRAIIGKLGSAGGVLRSNDMAFLDANEVKELNTTVEQKMAGIGVVLRPDPETHEVIAQELMPGSPAIRGGLHAGDRFVQINGVPAPENNLKETVELLRGPVGTTLKVAVKREGSPNLVHLELVRDVIRLSSVRGNIHRPDGTWDYMLDDQAKIGYVQVTYSAAETLNDVRAALNDLKARGVKALVLDLRDNPGGTLDSAVAVADLFVDEGRIVTVKGRNSEKAYDAEAKGGFAKLPMAVLVNRRTGSAAEIIAACLQDHQRAAIVGERTVGQGLVRSLIPLKDGMGAALKLPVGAFYRPSGKNMNRFPDSKDTDDWGVQPDAGNDLTLGGDEWKQYEKYRNWRAAINPPKEPEVEFTDRQLQKGRECVETQLNLNQPPGQN